MLNSDPLIGEKSNKKDFRTISLYVTIAFFATFIFIIFAIAIFAKPTGGDNSKMNIVFVNDVHIDPLYVDNGVYDPSNKEYCRHPIEGATPSKFGKYGCDTPMATFISMSDHLKDAEPNADVVVFGGDSMGHSLRAPMEQICGNISMIIKNITKDYKNVPLLFTVGNNDFEPNYGRWENDTMQFEQLAEVMKDYLNEEQLKTFKKGAYYAQDAPKQNIRFLVLNTVIYSTSAGRKEFHPEYTDPYGQFQWMKEQVVKAKKDGKKLALLMHIPAAVAHMDLKPGFHQAYTESFFEAIKDGDISFILVSHTHKDQIIPQYMGQPLYRTLSAVSVTPAHNNNPGFRVYEVEGGKLSNYRQYFADIRPNPTDLKWELEYDFRSLYGKKDVSTESIAEVVDMIKKESKSLWNYRQMLFASADVDNSFYICALDAVTEEELLNCTRGVNNLDRLYPE